MLRRFSFGLRDIHFLLRAGGVAAKIESLTAPVLAK